MKAEIRVVIIFDENKGFQLTFFGYLSKLHS